MIINKNITIFYMSSSEKKSSSKKLRPALKTGSNKTKRDRHIVINEEMNTTDNKIPEPITDSTKRQRWTTVADEKLAREHVRNKRKGFQKARKEVPILAAMAARRKYNINDEDHISAPRSSRSTSITIHPSIRRRRSTKDEPKFISSPGKGPISKAVSSVFGFFRGNRGGKKTRKNRK
jgi:hypothetical protein